jgi:hypothetical protein
MPRPAKTSGATALDPGLLLDALRKALSGPKPLLGDDGLFPSGTKGKQTSRAATEQGYLSTRREKRPPPGGKGKAKEVVIAELTDRGRRHVLDADNPRQVLEALLPAVRALGETRPDQDTFKSALADATAACLTAIEGAFAKLQETVAAALARMEQSLRSAVLASAGPRLDPGPVLAALHAALERAATPVSVSAAPQPPTPPPRPPAREAAPLPEPASDQLRVVLHQAYDELCLYLEFRDKVVEIPRLYHEVARRLPGLSLTRFHRELEALRDERRIELHKLNEVNLARERALAIEKDGRLYYYVLWK